MFRTVKLKHSSIVAVTTLKTKKIKSKFVKTFRICQELSRR